MTPEELTALFSGTVVRATEAPLNNGNGDDYIELEYADGKRVRFEGLGYDGWWKSVIAWDATPKPESESAVATTRREMGIKR